MWEVVGSSFSHIAHHISHSFIIPRYYSLSVVGEMNRNNFRDIEAERELAVENDPMLQEAVEQTPDEELREAQQSGEVFEGLANGGDL